MAGHYSIVDPHLSCLYSGPEKLNHRLGRQQLHHRKQRHPGAEFSIHQKSFSPHTGYVMGNYHPITMISYAVEYKISKLDPKTYHTNNVLLHLINGILVYLFIWLLSGRILVASITAALFLLHPMHVESVAWISNERFTLLPV